MKTKRGPLKFLALMVLVLIFIIIIQTLNIQEYLYPSKIRDFVTQFGILSPVVFIMIYIVAAIFVIPATLLTIASGIIFGTFLGTLYTVIGATIGATAAFLIAKSLGEEFVGSKLKTNFKKIYKYDKKLENQGFVSVLFLRIIPLFPFNAINFLLGLTKVKLNSFILGTVIGIIPGSFALAFLGESIATFNITNIILSVLLFLALILISFIYKKVKSSKT